jgi:pyruvate/2-oxoglutarate dehydrogenase complex dihydrolipoamide acyltransferase (E2) component
MIHALSEVDVTRPRQHIRNLKARTGETLSFTAFVAACLGKAVAADRRIHAYRNWRNQLVLFDDVDILITVERPTSTGRFPFPHMIRAADKRTVRDIHAEIRAVQSSPVEGSDSQLTRWLPLVPYFIRGLLYWFVHRSPHLVKQHKGTVGMTSVGMFGDSGGWGIGMPSHTLAITLGGIGEKPGVIGGQIAIREYLSLTISFDHDIIDGAPAARFTQRLKELIETGDGLDDMCVTSEHTASSASSLGMQK